MRKQGIGGPGNQQNQEFSIQNEDFPALPGQKGFCRYSLTAENVCILCLLPFHIFFEIIIHLSNLNLHLLMSYYLKAENISMLGPPFVNVKFGQRFLSVDLASKQTI